MKILNLLESYDDAIKILSRNNDPEMVKMIVDKFKKLSSANRIPKEQRDITQWMKKPFQELMNFVNEVEGTSSGKQLKRLDKKDVIKIMTKGKWLVIVPLTREASKYYGKGTEWCTSMRSNEKNAFDGYFGNGKALVYFINTIHEKKYACEIDLSKNKIGGCYDERDSSIWFSDIEEETGIDEQELLSHISDFGIGRKVLDFQFKDNKLVGEIAELETRIEKYGDFKKRGSSIELENIFNFIKHIIKNSKPFIEGSQIASNAYYKYIKMETEINEILNAGRMLNYMEEIWHSSINGRHFYKKVSVDSLLEKLKSAHFTKYMQEYLTGEKYTLFLDLRDKILQNETNIKSI